MVGGGRNSDCKAEAVKRKKVHSKWESREPPVQGLIHRNTPSKSLQHVPFQTPFASSIPPNCLPLVLGKCKGGRRGELVERSWLPLTLNQTSRTDACLPDRAGGWEWAGPPSTPWSASSGYAGGSLNLQIHACVRCGRPTERNEFGGVQYKGVVEALTANENDRRKCVLGGTTERSRWGTYCKWLC